MTTADEVIAKYDEIARANDALAAVATCDDGVYGAWGEVSDTADEMGYSAHDADRRGLYVAFQSYQRGLRSGLGLTVLA